MRATPLVAIVGRPNVGKSTLINRLIGARKAIVDDQPGVTRDRSYFDVDWNGRDFTLIDTGGITAVASGPEADPFAALINEQVAVAQAEADVILLLLDGRSGMTPVDQAIANDIRRLKKPVVVAVNKIDTPQQAGLIAEFYALGLGDPIATSALHGFGGVGDLLDALCEALPPEPSKDGADTGDETIRMAIVGRPNVGKSSLLNALSGQARAIVSEVSGTTRDAVEATLVRTSAEGRQRRFVAVDTAGIRKKAKVPFGIELFSVDRAIRAIREADVTVLVLDANDGVTDQDKRLIETSNRAGRALVLVVNKWDSIADKKPHSTETYRKELLSYLPHGDFAVVVFVSAKTGQRVERILEAVQTAYANARRRIRTHLVNQVIAEAVSLHPPPMVKNRGLNVLYATQGSVDPPTFILFANDAKLMKDDYRRYLEKKLRESFDFTGCPVRLVVRTRESRR